MIESREHVISMEQISDVDSFGAALGVYCAARELGKRCQIVLNEVTSSLRPLKECFTPEKGYPENMFLTSEWCWKKWDNKATATAAIPTARSDTECPELLKECRRIAVFDHHRQGSEVIENPVLSYQTVCVFDL